MDGLAMVNFRLLQMGSVRSSRSENLFLWGIATLLFSTPLLPALSEPLLLPVAQSESSSPADLSLPSDSSPSAATNPAISFRRPLRVTDVRIPNNWEFRRSHYLFTFDFPADAVEPLEKLVFEQVEGADYPRYRADDSYAFDASDRAQLPLSRVENNRDRKTITVEFDPPIEPGRQVTVALRARNPRDGIYVYRLTAFPVGASEGQYAGVEQLTFYEPVRRDRFRWR